MPTDEKAIKKFQRMMAVLDDDTLTRAEFLKAFENVVNLVLKVEKRNTDFIDALKSTIARIKDSIKESSDSDFTKLKADMALSIGMLTARLEAKSKQIDDKMALIKDGKDADEESIIMQVLSRIKLPEYRAPMMDGPEEIRDKIETLQGKERLKIEAVDNLREELDELKARPVGRGGGGTSAMGVAQALKYVIKRQTPTGAVDGVNASYTLSSAPYAVLSLCINGEMVPLSGNYTISGRTVTFATPIPAAYSGKDFEIVYV